MRLFLLWVSLTLGAGALAQPKEEPVPEGILGLPEIRIFIDSPVWFAWKLPSSRFTLAYLQGTAKPPQRLCWHSPWRRVRLSCSSMVRWNAKGRRFELKGAPSSGGREERREVPGAPEMPSPV